MKELRLLTVVLGAVMLVVLSYGPATPAAPTEDNKEAADKFLALKKRLPNLVAMFVQGSPFSNADLQIARRTSPTEGKITVVCYSGIDKEKTHTAAVFSIYLQYFDGSWTTTRLDGSWSGEPENDKRAVRLLMLAIDKIGEK